MAIKDVIGRGIGPSTSLLYFVTGGLSIGAPASESVNLISISSRDRRIKVVSRDRREIGKE